MGVLLAVAVSIDAGILYPKDSESRQVMNLDGLWKFAVSDKDNQNQGFDEQWYLLPLDKVCLKKKVSWDNSPDHSTFSSCRQLM